MAKSGQYTRGKRVAMQITLALVLAGTIGLAAAITRRRARDTDLDLGSARQVGRLVVRMPQGWRVDVTRAPDTGWAEVQAAGPDGRTVTVVQDPLPGAGAAAAPMAYVARKSELTPRKLRLIWMLEREGYRADKPDLPLGTNDDGEIIEGYGLYAGTVLPPVEGSAIPVGVLVMVRGPGSVGPAARGLLMAVAEGLAEAPAGDPATGPATAPATAPTTVPAEEENQVGDADHGQD